MNNFIFILIILILVCLILYYNKKNKIEKFESNIYNEPILTYDVIQEKIPYIHIYKNQNEISTKLDSIRAYKNIKLIDVDKFEDIERREDNLYYTDVYTFNKLYKKNYKAITLCTIPKSLLLVSKVLIDDITNTPLRIGYLNEIDLRIVKKIIRCHNNFVTMKDYEFKKIEVSDIEEELFNLNNLDIFVYYNTLTNPIYDMIRENDFNLVRYDDINKDLMNHYFPFYKRRIHNIITSQDNISEVKVLFYNTLEMDTIIFTTKENENFNKNYDMILNHFNEFLKINYYMQYFDFINYSQDWALEQQNKIKDILEPFQEKNKGMLFIIDDNINNQERINFQNAEILSNDDVKIFKVFITSINQIPINNNDRFIFTFNIGDFKVNKLYYVGDIEDNYIMVEDSKKVLLSDNDKEKVNSNLIELSQETITKYELEYGDSVFVMGKRLGVIINKKGNLYVLLEEKKGPKFGKEYKNLIVRESCVTDEIIGREGSNYVDDVYDNKRVDKSTDENVEDIYEVERNFNIKTLREWDSPCESNEECPFYLKNKNYPNKRGGCVNGYCEFPLGLKRIGYTKYYDVINENNHPICDDCEDEDDIYCCEKQGADHDNFKGPNYIYSRNPDEVL